MTVHWTSLCYSRHDSQLQCLFIRHLCNCQLNKRWRSLLFWLFWLWSFFWNHFLWSNSFFFEETFIHLNEASNVKVSSFVRCDSLACNERIFSIFFEIHCCFWIFTSCHQTELSYFWSWSFSLNLITCYDWLKW